MPVINDVKFVRKHETDYSHSSIAGALNGTQQIIACADNVTIDLSNGSSCYMELDRATCQITLSNPVNGQVYRIALAQDDTGGRLVTWSDTIRWSGGTAPTLTATASQIDVVTLFRINDLWLSGVTLNF